MRASWRKHDLLESHGVSGVHSAVKDVEERDWQDVGRLQGARFQTEVFVKGDFLPRAVSTLILMFKLIIDGDCVFVVRKGGNLRAMQLQL